MPKPKGPDLSDPIHAQNFRWLGNQMQSGKPLKDSFAAITASATNGPQWDIWIKMGVEVSKGRSLSAAMESENFPDHFVQMMKAGERIGASYVVALRLGHLCIRIARQRQAQWSLLGPALLGGLGLFLGVSLMARAAFRIFAVAD